MFLKVELLTFRVICERKTVLLTKLIESQARMMPQHIEGQARMAFKEKQKQTTQMFVEKTHIYSIPKSSIHRRQRTSYLICETRNARLRGPPAQRSSRC